MTDYSNMTDTEINEAVMRRVFGYEKMFADDDMWYTSNMSCSKLIDFATDLNEAWKIVMELAKNKVEFRLEVFKPQPYHTGSLEETNSVVEACFHDSNMLGAILSIEDVNQPARAICEEALQYLDAKQKLPSMLR